MSRQIVFFFLALSSGLAWGTPPVSSIPSMFYQTPFLTMDDLVMGSTCYSLPAAKDGLECNPAYMFNHQKRAFRFNLVGDRGLKDLIKKSDMIHNDDVIGLVDDVARQSEPVSARAAASFWYQHDWWAVGYVPARLKYVSNVQNPAYPQLGLSLIHESEGFVRAGAGVESIDGLAVGLNFRYLSQKYIQQEEDLFDIIANPSSVQVEHNRVISLEPGMTYSFYDSWQSSMSLAMTHWDVYASSDSYGKLKPGVELGFSTIPEFANNRLATSTHFSLAGPKMNIAKRFRWGFRFYVLDDLSVMANVAKGDYGIGVSAALQSFIMGIAYKKEELDYARWDAPSTDTVIFELGLRF